jgi:hypothetical protein
MDELYGSETLLQIILVTGVIGGGAAFLAGRAIAQTWRPFWSVAVYMAMLGAAVRFVHFALFEATLVSPPSYAADTAYLIVVGALAWRMTRAGQILLALRAHRPFDLEGTRARRANSGREPTRDQMTCRGDRQAKTGQNVVYPDRADGSTMLPTFAN